MSIYKQFVKTTFIIICTFAMVSLNVFNVQASEEDGRSPIDVMTGVETIDFLDKEVKLYNVFVDRNNALSKMKDEYKYFLSYVQDGYNLQDFSSTTIKTYEETIHAHYYDLIESGFTYDELSNFSYNISAYSLQDENDEIVRLIKKYTENKSVDLLLQIDLISPSYSNKLYQRPQVLSYFNRTAAIDYANKYAYTPNRSKYEALSSDCTNFASQIAHAAGIPLLNTSSAYSGWWYGLKLYPDGDYYYAYSNSWVRAINFVNWYGVSYMYYGDTAWRNAMANHNDFSNRVKAGDFIALDYQGDGSWDHVGFVVGKGAYGVYRNGAPAGAASGWGFTNYKVAQHTGNYNAWASDYTTVGWPNLFESEHTLIAIIRTPM